MIVVRKGTIRISSFRRRDSRGVSGDDDKVQGVTVEVGGQVALGGHWRLSGLS